MKQLTLCLGIVLALCTGGAVIAGSKTSYQSPEFSLQKTLIHDKDDLITAIAISPDSTILATAVAGYSITTGTIRLWDIRTGTLLHKISEKERVHSVAFSPDGRTLASISGDYVLKLWDVQTGNLKQRSFGGIKPGVSAIVFSPDGTMLVTEGFPKGILFWNPQTGKLLRTLTGVEGSLNAIVFSPDGKMLVSGGYANTITIWDVQTNKIKKTLETKSYIGSIAFSPDGSIMASSVGGDILLWSTDSWEVKRALRGDDNVNSIAFSPDGEMLAVASNINSTQVVNNRFVHGNSYVRIWDVATGNLKQVLLRQIRDGECVCANELTSVAFSPDGRLLATGSSGGTAKGNNDDGTVKLWDTYRTITTITGYVDVIEATGSGCRIRIIAGDKLYSGVIGFSRLSVLTKAKINSYEDAVAFLNGKQITVTLPNLAYYPSNVPNISFGNISQIIFPAGKETRPAAQTWNERNTATETIIDLSADILFDFDKSTIRPDAIPTLIRLARFIRQSQSGTIQLNGFTDSIGSDEYNMGLSERRANAVKQWLVSKGGVDAGRLQTKGYGKSQPVAPNTNPDGSDNPAGRQKNRRVEIRVPRS